MANHNGEQEKLKELQKENDQLVKYIEKGENEILGILPRGAGIPELKSRQAQNRKLKQLRTRAQKALELVKEVHALSLWTLRTPPKLMLNMIHSSQNMNP